MKRNKPFFRIIIPIAASLSFIIIDNTDAQSIRFSDPVNIITGLDMIWSAYPVDMDFDGKTDILSASVMDSTIALHMQTEINVYDTRIISDTLLYAFSAFPVDLDKDGDLDIIAGGDGEVVWFENTGDLIFTGHNLSGDVSYVYGLHAGDLEDDGDIDILISSSSGSHVGFFCFINDGFQNFTIDTLSTESSRSVCIIDLDSDGHTDMLTSGGPGNSLTWWRNNGSNEYVPDSLGPSSSTLYLADIDSDGDPYIVARNTPYIVWLENMGNTDFETHMLESYPLENAYFLNANDFDNDGDMDILASTGSAYYKILWYENDGNQGFSSYHHIEDPYLDNSPFLSVYSADMDNDNDYDIIAAKKDYDAIAFYENVCNDVALEVWDTTCTGTGYVFGDRVLYTTGTFYDTLPSFNGCDSTITLHLRTQYCSNSVDPPDMEDVIMYPNPTHDKVYFNKGQELSYVIYSGIGKPIYRSKGKEIHLSGLSEGIYFIQVTDENHFVHICKVVYFKD